MLSRNNTRELVVKMMIPICHKLDSNICAACDRVKKIVMSAYFINLEQIVSMSQRVKIVNDQKPSARFSA